MQKLRKWIKYLFPAIAVLLLIALVLSRVVQTDSSPPEPEISISANEAVHHEGEAAEVCGDVAGAEYLPQIGGEPTFINFGEPHPNQHFTAVIWGENRGRWSVPPDQQFSSGRVCVRGEIRIHEGTPQIVVTRPEQIFRR